MAQQDPKEPSRALVYTNEEISLWIRDNGPRIDDLEAGLKIVLRDEPAPAPLRAPEPEWIPVGDLRIGDLVDVLLLACSLAALCLLALEIVGGA